MNIFNNVYLMTYSFFCDFSTKVREYDKYLTINEYLKIKRLEIKKNN